MSWDVVVWGGGTGGCAAAVQSARTGASTLLLTPGHWLGGMLSAAGVSAPDGHELSCWQTGLWGALIRDLQPRVPEGLDQNWVSCFGFRPDQAEAVLQEWVAAEELLTWWPGTTLLDVGRRADRIDALTVRYADESISLTPEIVVDGSDLGDLMARAEVPFRWGWEPRECWNEPSAPPRLQLSSDPFFRRQPVQSPTWVAMGQLTEARLPVQSLVRPQEPFRGCLETFGLERTLTYGRLPGGLVMLNWPKQGNDWHIDLGRCISPDPKEKDDLAVAMRRHSRAFLDTLRACSGGALEAGSAFPGPSPELALMPYWREGRRLVGDAVVTECDLLPVAAGRRGPLPLDASGRCTSIAVGTYANDHHYPGEDWPLAPKSCRWGGRWTGTPFCVPLAALVSRSAPNLLMADKAFSVSHMANGATRLQPLMLNLGQAAGLAAALSIRRATVPAELPVEAVQHALLEDPVAPAAVLPLWEWPSWHPDWAQAQRRGLCHPDAVDEQGNLHPAQVSDLSRPQPDGAPCPGPARRFKGSLFHGPDGALRLSCGQGDQTLITLEPAVNQRLMAMRDAEPVELIAAENPWGPWLRVIQVLDASS